MSSGCSSFSFRHTSSTSLSRTQSLLSFRSNLNPYRICSHAAFHPNLALPMKRRFGGVTIRCSVPPEGSPPLLPLPSDPPSGLWKTWVVGTLVAVLLSFVKGKWAPFLKVKGVYLKWAPLLKLKDEIEIVVETADRVAEVVEKVAEQVEEMAEAVADHTPENSKVHAAAALLKEAAEEVAKDAHLADVALDKVEEVEKEVESLIEPITGQARGITKEPDA